MEKIGREDTKLKYKVYLLTQDGNGAPKPASPRVFTLLGDGDGRLSIPAGLLVGTLKNWHVSRV